MSLFALPALFYSSLSIFFQKNSSTFEGDSVIAACIVSLGKRQANAVSGREILCDWLVILQEALQSAMDIFFHTNSRPKTDKNYGKMWCYVNFNIILFI